MNIKTQKAFTMVELIFVIIIIGILSAIAVPKFTETAHSAYDAKGGSILVNVMSAIALERQKRILKGDFDAIEDLGDSTYAFSKFKNGNQNDVLAFSAKNCTSGQAGCWSRTDATHYIYNFSDSNDGNAKFKLEKNRLVCDNDSSDCDKLLSR